MIKKILFSAALWALASTVSASDISAYLANLDSNDYAARQTARLDLRQELVDAGFFRRRAYEKELLQFVGPTTPWETRDWTIRMLELIGGKSSVKPLAALLQDPDERIRDCARRTLSAIPSSSALRALETTLTAAAPADQPAYIDALAYRGQSSTVRALSTILDSGAPAPASHAAVALGKISGRSAQAALSRRHTSATGPLKTEIERALIEAGLTDAKLAHTLALSGQSAAIRTAAFRQLTSLDRSAATKVLQTAMTDPSFSRRDLLIKAAINSAIRDEVIAQLATLSETDQAVVLGAIADRRLSSTEANVLALLPHASATLQPTIIRTLGVIGSDQSYDPLYTRYIANNRDRDVAEALSRLNAPSADEKLLASASGSGQTDDRVSALRLLVLRNTTGVTPLLNQLAQPEHAAALRQAAFKGMEVVGDTASVSQLLTIVLAQDSLKRQAQGSLKKLSVSIGAPDYLWKEFYAPALDAAADNDARQGVLEILDGISGEASAAYVQSLILTAHPLRADALTVLNRWSDISAGSVWLALANHDHATPADHTAATTGLKRVISSKRLTGGGAPQVKLAARAITQIASPEFTQAVLSAYEGRLDRDTSREFPKSFKPLLQDPALAPQIQAILDRI
jgi:hypothetical protein